MTDAREALGKVIWEASRADEGTISYIGANWVADAILAEFDVTPRENEVEWEYGVKWGDEPDDSQPAICYSRAHAESRAAASYGDRVVRRTPARTLPAGPWVVVEDD